MNQRNYYHIQVSNESTVKVKKFTDNLTESVGIFQPNKVTDQIREIIKNPAELKDKQIQKVGEALFEALFCNQLRNDFLDFYKRVTIQRDQTLEVILEINETALPEVVAYPWELMCLPQRYNQGDIHLATHPKLNFFRCRYNLEERDKFPIRLRQEEKLKIVLGVARPTNDPQLSNIEFQEIESYLTALANQQDKIIEFFPVINPATIRTISSRLRENKPDIFHFIGHGRLQEENGREIGQIALVNDEGGFVWKNADYFSILFQRHRPKVVILQACETGKQSETNAFSSVAYQLMLQGIPVVIAMQYKVSNLTAKDFVKDFYEEIIKDNPVQVAVQQARYNIALNKGYEQKDFAIPVIYMNGADGYLFSVSTPPDEDTPSALDIAQEIINYYGNNEQRLKSIFTLNEQTFGSNFYGNIQGEDVNTRIMNLAVELIKTNKLESFVTIARQHYPSFARLYCT